MDDEIITADEIYLQDVICSMVAENPNADDFAIYNRVVGLIDVPDLKRTCKILELIKLNKMLLKTENA